MASEAESRLWNRLSPQHKAMCVAFFYVSTALLPFVSCTAVVFFLLGRWFGARSEQLNAEIKEQERSRIVSEVLDEFVVAQRNSERDRLFFPYSNYPTVQDPREEEQEERPPSEEEDKEEEEKEEEKGEEKEENDAHSSHL